MSFASVACVTALVLVACSDDEQPAPPSETSTPGATATEGCEENAGLAGTPATNQVPGDCKRVVCNADGTTQTVPDDTDLPPSTECMTFTCSGGTKASMPKAAGTPCTGGLCDGAGTCVIGLGTACTGAEDCPSGSCVDGVCCNEACTGECQSCSVDGMKGICSNVPYYEEDPSYVSSDGEPLTCDLVISGSRCDGKGACLRISRVTCLNDEQCMSGKCSNLKCLGAPGELCEAAGDCVSGTCVMGACK